MNNLSNVQLMMLVDSLETSYEDGHWKHEDEEKQANELLLILLKEIESRGYTYKEFCDDYSYLFSEDDPHGFEYH